MGCGSVKGEGGMLFGERFSWLWTMEERSILEEHLVWGHPFENLFPIFVFCRHLEACFRYVMLRSGLMMGDYATLVS